MMKLIMSIDGAWKHCGAVVVGEKDGQSVSFGPETYAVTASDLRGWASRVSTHLAQGIRKGSQAGKQQ